jgi:hypothetical protein
VCVCVCKSSSGKEDEEEGVGVQAGAREEHRICERREGSVGAVSLGTFGREFSSLGRVFRDFGPGV